MRITGTLRKLDDNGLQEVDLTIDGSAPLSYDVSPEINEEEVLRTIVTARPMILNENIGRENMVKEIYHGAIELLAGWNVLAKSAESLESRVDEAIRVAEMTMAKIKEKSFSQDK